MAVLAKGFNVPFMVEGKDAEEALNKKPTPEQIAEAKRLAEKCEKGVFVVKESSHE